MHSVTVHFSPAGVAAAQDNSMADQPRSGTSPADIEDPLDKLWRAINMINMSIGNLQNDSKIAADATKIAIDTINARLKEHDIWFDKLVWNRDTRSKTPYR